MSDPNCRRLVSECIFLEALSVKAPESSELDRTGEGNEKLPDLALSVRLSTGDRGISCSCGRDWKPVMQSTTSTFAALLDAGARLGRWAVAG